MTNTWFSSDLHFSHKNILKFCEATRPFNTLTEMNQYLIKQWQSQVQPEDDVWLLGDVFFCKIDEALSIIDQLPGNKHLVYGNHDGVIQKHPHLQNKFVSTHDYKELQFGRRDVVLFHFPVREWCKMHYGAWHFHGHCHGKIQQDGRSLDVGWDGPLGQQLLSVDMIRPFMDDRPIMTHHSTGLPNEKIIEKEIA